MECFRSSDVHDGCGCNRLCGAALSTLSFFPQAIKTLRTDDTRSISLSMYGLFAAGVAIWAAFGLLSGNGPVILANGLTLIPASFVLQKKIRHHLNAGER